MPRMPKTEEGLIALAQQVEAGLTSNPNLTDSPITKEVFAAALAAFIAKRNEVFALEANVGERHDEKDDLQDDLEDKVERVINYLDVVSDGDETELASIGWGTSAAPVKQPPGQPRALEILSQTDAALSLDWKNPADGGNVASYRVERRERPAGAWETCFATNKTDAVLTGQPKGKELEYRVVAYNSNGDSIPSNSVAAVL